MSIPVSYPYNASGDRTSSSKLACRERSPRPFTHVWGTATPASAAARLFATASPKSLCPWNDNSVGFSRRFSCSKNQVMPGGVITPTVSHTTARWDPAAVHASYRSTTKSRSARNVSSVTNDTSTPCATAYSVSRTAASFTCSRVIELVFDVQVGSGGEQRDLIDVAGDARLHILPDGPGRGHDCRVEAGVRDHPDAPRLLARDDRDPDVHHRDVDLVQDAGDPDLLLRRVRDPGRLFAAPQGRRPDPDSLRDPRRQARLDEVVVDQAFLRDAAPPLFARVTPRHDLKLSRGWVYRRHGRSPGNGPTVEVRPRVRSLVSGERPSTGDRPLLGLRGGRVHSDARGAGPAERMGVRSETRRDVRGHLRPRS